MRLTISTKSILIILLSLFYTNHISSQTISNNNAYFDNIIILKIRAEYKSFNDNDNKALIANQLANYLSTSNNLIIEKEFTNSIAPKAEYNKHGFRTPDISTIYRISFQSHNDIQKTISQLKSNPIFEYVEPLYKVELLYVPNDPMNSTSQYWLTTVKAFEAWDIHKGDTNTVIGISDTGIDLGHSDLFYNIKYNYNDLPDGIDNDNDGYIDNFKGWNFGDNNNNTQADLSHHGTWVAGIAGASTDNAIGVSGAGFKCKILPLKIMNKDGILANPYQSILYAAEHNCKVVNCSWGGDNYQKMAQDLIDYVTDTYDILVVSAAGNTNSEINYYPASYYNVLSVAGTTERDEKWTPENSPTRQGSSYSHRVDLSAPSTSFQSTNGDNSYTLMWGGTSFAAPIVAGCAGILRSYYPDYNAQQIIAILKASTDNIDTIEYNAPYINKLGKGRLNMYKALTLAPQASISFRNTNNIYDNNTLTINGVFTNHLADANNLKITVEALSNVAEITNNTIYNGNLSALSSYISENQIIINLNQDVEYDYFLPIKLIYEADNYTDFQIIDINIKPGFKNIHTDILSLSAASNGRLGYNDVNSSIGNGFFINNLYSLFYDCGIISGTSATNLYSSVRQISDFKTITYPYLVNNSEIADEHIRTEFNDSNDIAPLGINIIQDLYAWRGMLNKNFIITDYQIINNSLYDIDNYYFGLLTDWDLSLASNNSAVYLSDDNFTYCQSNNSQTLFSGIKLLSNQPIKNYIALNKQGGDGIIDVHDGLIDLEKFHIISNNNITNADSIGDILIYTGAGPFSIKSQDTIHLGFSIIASETLIGLKNALLNSKHIYNNILHPQDYIAVNQNNDIYVYPNPCNGILNIIYNEDIGTSSLEIYNNIGKIVYSSTINHTNSIDISHLKSGIYNLKIQSTKDIIVKKIIVITE